MFCNKKSLKRKTKHFNLHEKLTTASIWDNKKTLDCVLFYKLECNFTGQKLLNSDYAYWYDIKKKISG